MICIVDIDITYVLRYIELVVDIGKRAQRFHEKDPLPFVQRCTVSYKGCEAYRRTVNEDEDMKHEWEREREGKNSTVEELRGVRVRVRKRSKKLE